MAEKSDVVMHGGDYGEHLAPMPHETVDIPALLHADGLARTFAVLSTPLLTCPEAERAAMRQEILGALETAPEVAPASLAAPEELKTFLEASPAYLKVKETRRDAEAPTIQERLSRLLSRALDTKSPSERGACVMAVLPQVTEISVLCELFRIVEGNWTGDHASRPPEDTYFGTSTAALRDALFARVQIFAKKGTLWSQGSPTAILWFWWACGEEQRVYTFIKDSMGDAKALPALLDEIVYRVATPEEEYDVIPVRRWSKIIDFQALEQSAATLSMTGPVREDRRKARRFLDAFGNGKSELYR